MQNEDKEFEQLLKELNITIDELMPLLVKSRDKKLILAFYKFVRACMNTSHYIVHRKRLY